MGGNEYGRSQEVRSKINMSRKQSNMVEEV